MNKYLVEFIGTAFFAYVILATGNPLAIGASFALLMLLAANISGGYFNPAISIIMASLNRISVYDLIPYILSQVFGALVALQIFKRYRI
jgi:aquaporin Z